VVSTLCTIGCSLTVGLTLCCIMNVLEVCSVSIDMASDLAQKNFFVEE